MKPQRQLLTLFSLSSYHCSASKNLDKIANIDLNVYHCLEFAVEAPLSCLIWHNPATVNLQVSLRT